MGGSAQGKMLVRSIPTGKPLLFVWDSRNSTVDVFLGKNKPSQHASCNPRLLNELISKKCLREEATWVISFAKGDKCLLPIHVPHLPS